MPAREQESLMSHVETEDLIKYGLIPEFVGRFPVVSILNHLDEKDMLDILVKPKNALAKQFQKFFDMAKAGSKVTPETIRATAQSRSRPTDPSPWRSILTGWPL